ncbi:MAG: hemerythrin domain-containing protein [Candidatus Kapaibacterium sp.]|jgi:iron-sulfur cluster repair protein YtfE (RIC family)
MPRHAALVPLSHDHHHALLLALRLKKSGPVSKHDVWPTGLLAHAKATVEMIQRELYPHFMLEEQILFPEARSIPNANILIDQLLAEHAKMRNGKGEILALADKSATEELSIKLVEFGTLLEQHIRREERELFPVLEASFSSEIWASLKLRIDQAGPAFRAACAI